VCSVRVRPWHPEKELPFISQHINEPVFLGDGNFAMSPRRPTTGGSIREVVGMSACSRPTSPFHLSTLAATRPPRLRQYPHPRIAGRIVLAVEVRWRATDYQRSWTRGSWILINPRRGVKLRGAKSGRNDIRTGGELQRQDRSVH
jgi:hypothetical protein